MKEERDEDKEELSKEFLATAVRCVALAYAPLEEALELCLAEGTGRGGGSRGEGGGGAVYLRVYV
ncbi:hypothetical protein E2C01_075149 [Portunus trituberculatus]|uniref:Uncharacterized protein n=1 Tax=Portunus trituberculatus TaxID=210409 RepID=A0A5B7IG48_PORTR|nr:hypothetical protein [Portunus trituberculatus]